MAINRIIRPPMTALGGIPIHSGALPVRLLAGLVAVVALMGFETEAHAGVTSVIGSSFNGTAVPGGDTIWFNSVFDTGTPPTTPITIFVTNSTITINGKGVNETLSVPNAAITFSPTATQATTTFDASTNTWDTTLPTSHLAGSQFLDGVGFKVPASGLPAGIDSVSWTGDFSATAPFSLNWKWGAAAYSSFSSNYNALGIKPVDDNSASQYMNSDHAGTPENFTSFVVAGATGGGGSNFTGSYSGTARVSVPAVPEPSSLALAAITGALVFGTLGRNRLRRTRAA